MKSIVQEGSTITKAVESAWQAAGQPKEFTVKILEEPQHNFIGMTTRSAKVAIFFTHTTPVKTERPRARTEREKERKERTPRGRRQVRAPRSPGRGAERRPQRERRYEGVQEGQPTEFVQEPVADKVVVHEKREYDGVFWTPEMVIMAKEWLQEALSALDRGHVHYATDVNRLYLKIFFDEPIKEDENIERQVFRSFAMLLMQHMRNRLNRPLRGFKVVLSRGES